MLDPHDLMQPSKTLGLEWDSVGLTSPLPNSLLKRQNKLPGDMVQWLVMLDVVHLHHFVSSGGLFSTKHITYGWS